MKVSPDAHAFDADNATENRKVPALLAVHTEMSVSVSDVPPFVHGPTAPDRASADPDDEAENVAWILVVEPALIAVVPAAPGLAVCSWT
nr:hypothetical protein [Streptomyces cyanogenus]